MTKPLPYPLALALAASAGIAVGSIGHPVAVTLANQSGLLALASSLGLCAAAAHVLVRGDAKPDRGQADPYSSRPHTYMGAEAWDLSAWRIHHGVPEEATESATSAIRKVLADQVGIGSGEAEQIHELLLRIFVIHERAATSNGRNAHAILRDLFALVRSGKLSEVDAFHSDVMAGIPLQGRSAIEEVVAMVRAKHASGRTVLMGALDRSRKRRGPLSSAEFTWLRAHDRTLWYGLNDLGRHAGHIEALGLSAHYQAELYAGTGLRTPHVEAAVEAVHDKLYATRSPTSSAVMQAPPGPGLETVDAGLGGAVRT